MVRGDPMQRKLLFERSKQTGGTEAVANMEDGADGSTAAAALTGLDAVMSELKTEFRTIDAHFDAITTQLDRMASD